MKIKYYVELVDDSIPMLMKFKSKKDAKKFIKEFKKLHPTVEHGFWINYLIEGNVKKYD